jgi:hypothetical protein
MKNLKNSLKIKKVTKIDEGKFFAEKMRGRNKREKKKEKRHKVLKIRSDYNIRNLH